MTSAPHLRNCLLTADQSCAILAQRIRTREPFFFIRYGDGAIECMSGKQGGTRDGEVYTDALAHDLLRAWQSLMTGISRGHIVYVGDWLSASFDSSSEGQRYEALYQKLIGTYQPTFLHFESLLLMRESEALVDFYRAVASSPLRKVYMGPYACREAAHLLRAEHLPTPMGGLHQHVGKLSKQLRDLEFDILLYGAGMAGNIAAVTCWEEYPQRTYVNIGSALDTLGLGKTRMQQLGGDRVHAMFKELL